MDYENQNNNTNQKKGTMSGEGASASGEAGSAAATATPSLEQLMTRSPALSPFCGWLKCLRKPALSMQYSIRKRHIPVLDADTGEQSEQSGQNGQSSQDARGSQGQTTAPTAKAGQTSDIMGVNGGFTIRYFDLVMGVIALTVLGCVMKGCCWMKKRMM